MKANKQAWSILLSGCEALKSSYSLRLLDINSSLFNRASLIISACLSLIGLSQSRYFPTFPFGMLGFSNFSITFVAELRVSVAIACEFDFAEDSH